jgi:hypothetical protein
MNDQSLVVAPRSATVRYDEMCRAIELAYAVDEVKKDPRRGVGARSLRQAGPKHRG